MAIGALMYVSDSDPRKKKIKIKDILHEPPDEKN